MYIYFIQVYTKIAIFDKISSKTLHEFKIL